MDNRIPYLLGDCIFACQHCQRRFRKENVDVSSEFFFHRKLNVPWFDEFVVRVALMLVSIRGFNRNEIIAAVEHFSGCFKKHCFTMTLYVDSTICRFAVSRWIAIWAMYFFTRKAKGEFKFGNLAFLDVMLECFTFLGLWLVNWFICICIWFPIEFCLLFLSWIWDDRWLECLFMVEIASPVPEFVET